MLQEVPSASMQNLKGWILIISSLSIPSDVGIMTWESNSFVGNPWTNSEGLVQTVETHNLQSSNGVLRNTEMIHVHSGTGCYISDGAVFIDSFNVHNVYLHCPNLGHFNSIGVRGESTIINKLPVSSSFGYLIIDSVVAPHGKIDVPRQLVKNHSI